MTDFLLELYSEEIPAGMQARGVKILPASSRNFWPNAGSMQPDKHLCCPAAHGRDDC